jgi:L-aspartate oxidase
VGEASCTGVHGANRLASNSLLECLVFGAGFTNSDLQPAMFVPASLQASIDTSAAVLDWEKQQIVITTIRQGLPGVMWQVAGIVREATSLQSGLEQIKAWQAAFDQLPISQALTALQPQQNTMPPFSLADLRLWAETRNLLKIGHLIVNSALFRTESRGGHFRSDFAASDMTWENHTLISSGKWVQSSGSKVLEIL